MPVPNCSCCSTSAVTSSIDITRSSRWAGPGGWRWRLPGETGPTIVANACDPLVVWSAGTAANVIWVETATVWHADGALCPACGTVLVRVPADGRDTLDVPRL